MLKVMCNLRKASAILVVALFFSAPLALLMGGGLATAETIDTNVKVEPSLTVNLPTTPLDITLDPATTTFGTKTLNISVSTNNDRGYQLTMTSDSTDLVNIADNTKAIPTFDTATLPSGGYTTADFPENHWGYKKDSGNYQDFKTSQTVLQNNGRTNEDSTSLTFAAKIDFLQPSGTYENTLVFTTTATPPIYMQDVDSTMCSTTETLIVTDVRDGEKYGIRKLPDGNCWMTKNLNLAGGTTLTPETSNVTSNYTLPASPASISSSDFSDNSPYVYNTGRTVCGENLPCYSYYSYAAATAGSGTSISSGNATSDICPKGWRIPTRTESTALINIYGITISNPPYNAVYNGLYDNGSFTKGGESGRYWTSTSTAGTFAAYPVYSASGVSDTAGHKRAGLGVRCILDTRTLSDITYMQEMTPNIVANTASGATKNLIDTRDSKTYAVTKIGDKIWMTQNLRFLGTSVEPSKTDIDHTVSSISWNEITTESGTGGACRGDTVVNDGIRTGVGGGYSNFCYHDSGNTTNGVWYNYAAATAGTIVGGSNTNSAEYSICPKNWRLPTRGETEAIVANETLFNIVDGGYYGATAQSPMNGYWWLMSSAASSPSTITSIYTDAQYIAWNGTGNSFYRNSNIRTIALFIRCVNR